MSMPLPSLWLILVINLAINPTTVSPGGTLRVDYDFYGTGGDWPWETQTILIDGSQVACYSDNQAPNQWYPRTRYVTAPTSAGSHSLEVRVYGDNGYKAHCGAQDASDGKSFTVESPPSSDPNPDGDDLSSDEEQEIFGSGPVYDANGNPFPNSSITDAYKPIHAAELYYRRWYYNQEPLRYRKGPLIKDTSLEGLGGLGIFLAQLHKSTQNQTLKSDIEENLREVLDEIIYRQVDDDLPYYLTFSQLNASLSNYGITIPDFNMPFLEFTVMNMKGYIQRNRNFQDIVIKNGKAYDFIRLENPSVHMGYATMALLEGYEALGDVKYYNGGKRATDFLIGWHNFVGLNSEPEDEYLSNLWIMLLKVYFPPAKLLFGYHTVASIEKGQNGGDVFLSDPNNYGTSLNAIATMARVDSNARFKNLVNKDYEADGKTYGEIADWMVEEVRRLQRYNEEGGIRVGPLHKLQSYDRLQEMIHYSGMTAFGVRQEYDNDENPTAEAIVTQLADHYWYLRHDRNAWWTYWDLDKNDVLKDSYGRYRLDQDETWGSVIMISGFHSWGFRQGMVDFGGFLCSSSGQMNYILYQAMKMENSGGVIIPVNESVAPDCVSHPYRAGRSNPIIYPGENRTVSITVDSTVGRLLSELRHNTTTAQLKFYIITPAQETINSTNYVPFPGVNYVENGTYKYYEVDNPETGVWKLVLEAVDVPVDGELYEMQAILGTSLYASVEADGFVYANGESARLTTTLGNNESFVTGTQVSGQITNPDGAKSSVKFYDDGTNGDFIASDGVYTVTFLGTNVPGSYTVEVSASGTIGGTAFERTGSTSFDVMGSIEEKKAYLASFLYQRDYQSGDLVSGFIYVENEGNVEIDDELIITIKNPGGERVYKKTVLVYLEPGESQFVRYSWTIPEGSLTGLYRFKAEFEDEVDSIPTVKGFTVAQ